MPADKNTTFHGYGLTKLASERKADEPLLNPVSYHPRVLGEHDVDIAISHCGICASDIHTVTEGWGGCMKNTIPGHEIIGKVRAVGSKVSKHKVGDRVGVGAMVLACLDTKNCEMCKKGKNNYCPKRVFTYNAKFEDGEQAQGGYADGIRTDENYVFQISDKISSAEAAPLMCAGTTVFTPIHRAKVGKESKVGIIGVGGLGHLAIQFAAKLGAHVVSISTSSSKKADALKLGAKEHLDISDKEAVKAKANSLTHIFNTANAKGMDYDLYLSLLAFQGHFCLLAVPEEPMKFAAGSIIMKEIVLTGSLIGSHAEVQAMLDFAAKHDVRPLIEQMPMKECNAGIKKVQDNKVRYRVVLAN